MTNWLAYRDRFAAFTMHKNLTAPPASQAASASAPSLARHLRTNGVHVVGWQPFQELMRTGGCDLPAKGDGP